MAHCNQPNLALDHPCRLEFKVGERPLNNFRMIELHYFNVSHIGRPMHVLLASFTSPLHIGLHQSSSASTSSAAAMLAFPYSIQHLIHRLSLHGLQGQVVRVYDFTFGFCIPNSINTWEAIYDVPQYTKREIDDYVSEI